MPCYHPVTAYKSRSVNPTGKRSLVFKASDGLVGSELKIPCGGCIGCRIDRSQQWAVRLMHEANYWDQKCFVTLTYDELTVPSNGSLCKDHHQKFLKRLRKAHGGKIKYFLCGEYGETTYRPHYHAILFGIDFADRKRAAKNAQGDQLWVSDSLDKIWSHGNCWIGDVTHESCAYVARYIMKKVTGKAADEHYMRVDENGECYHLQPEYIAMSLKPAIGKQHYERYKSDFFPRDYAVSRGKQVPVPKYYDRLLERENPELLEELKQARVKRAKSSPDNTPDRLRVRETVKKSKLTQLRRDL